jgi:hypothetical protein
MIPSCAGPSTSSMKRSITGSRERRYPHET